jgi:hypothetical protein
MSKTRLVTIICWCLTAAILIGLVIWFLAGPVFGVKNSVRITGLFGGVSVRSLTGPYEEAGSYSVKADGIGGLDIDWTAGAVTVTPYDGSDIKFTEYAQRALDDREKLVYKASGGTLAIDYIAPGLNFDMITKKLEVFVPKALAGKLESLSVTATSADISISGLTVTGLYIDDTSGGVTLDGIRSDTTEVNSTSGIVNIRDTTAAELRANSVSGDIRLTGVTADKLNTSTTSGAHVLNGTFKDINAGSVSGDIKVTGTADPDRITCGTTSGNIVVTIPGNAVLNVDYSTVSGRFSSEIPVKTAGGSASYKFSTVSGSITLKDA